MNETPLPGPPVGLGPLAELSEKLRGLPDAKFLAVVEQLGPVTQTPAVAGLLDAYRARLRQLQPPRPLTLKRLFCRPFEDLLISQPPSPGLERIRIPRAAIGPSWDVASRNAASEIADLNATLRTIQPVEAKRLQALCERLWMVGARELAAETATEKPDHPCRLTLIRDALMAAPVIERFKRRVPAKLVPAIGANEKACIVGCINDLAVRQAPLIGFLLVVAARVRSPAELIRILGDTGVPVPEEIEIFAVARLSERVSRLGDTITAAGPEGLAKEIEEVLQAMADTNSVVGGAARTGLDQGAAGMEQAARAALDEHVIEAAPAALEAALEEEPGRTTLLTAEAHARALYRARKAAKRLGLGAKADAVIGAARQRFEAQIADEINAATERGGSAGTPAMFRAIRMIELVAGAEAARPHIRALVATNQSD
jgi:hypothetical protein